MKLAQWTLAALGTIALAIVAAGFVLPSRFEVARTTLINAPTEKIHDLIADPRRWKQWSTSGRRDPVMDITYSGPPFGQGAKWSWASKTERSGMMELTSVEPNRRVQYFAQWMDRINGEDFDGGHANLKAMAEKP